MSEGEFRYTFDRARDKAVAIRPELEASICDFQSRDLRAKAGTDQEEGLGIEAAQSQLGHASATMTRQYVRHRKGKLVTPTKREIFSFEVMVALNQKYSLSRGVAVENITLSAKYFTIGM